MARNMETGGQRIFPTFQQIGDNLSNTGTSIVNSLPNKNELTKALRDPEFYSDVGSRAKNMFTSMHPMDQVALTTAPFPILGDVTGLAADARMFSQEPESRTPLNFGLSALGALPFIPAASTIKAFHGTPHKIDKFSMDNIGTGEGAQAYGHGLYFADSPDVAGQYKKLGQRSINDDQFKILADDTSGILQRVGIENPRGFLEESKRVYGDSGDAAYRGLQDRLTPKQIDEVFDAANIEAGNLYNVNLDVEPEDLLDWDASIRWQPESIKNIKLEDIGISLKRNPRVENEQYELVFGKGVSDLNISRNSISVKGMPEKIGDLGNHVTGKHIYNLIASNSNAATASKKLNKASISGIQYYDGMSRGAGEGTRNYVMFDDNLIDIVDPIDDIVNKHNAALDSVK
tara:strand:+ start:1054 stop:2259 length:1206 start_codon:yes stop_codon:yes gene_type:complete